MRTRTKLLLISIFVLLGLLISPLSASAEINPLGLSDKLPKAMQSETIPNTEQFSKSEVIEPQQSTTGPLPSREVIERDNKKIQDTIPDINSEVTLSVPSYSWRHGCGPTAVGMVVGYYDGLGFDDLVPGSASSQTGDVNQMIASGGDSANPNPSGSEEHYEDYADPEDSEPTLLTDAVITAGRTPHTDNCLADFMDTSKSTRNNYYGWSYGSDVGPAFVDYVNMMNSSYLPSYQGYYSSDDTLTWSLLKNEIDEGRPMVFLVDTDGNGGTDHFITIIGYRTSPTLQYGAWDTWDTTNVRWENFSAMEDGVPWGIYGGWSFRLTESDLSLTVSTTSNTYIAGQKMIVDVGVFNYGPDTAFNTEVELNLPLGFHYLADTDTCVLQSSDPDVLLCSLGDLAQFSYPTFEVAIGIDPTLVREDPDGTMAFTITGEVFSGSFDPEPDNNVDETTFFVTDLADLHIEKFASPSNEVLAGEEFTYTIIVDNYGPSSARNVFITDTLVTSDEVVPLFCTLEVRTEGGSITISDCNFALSTGVFDLGFFGSNWLNPRSPTDQGRIIITITATAQETLTMTNKATVVSDTPELDSSDNMVEVTLSVVDLANLEIFKGVSRPGDPLPSPYDDPPLDPPVIFAGGDIVRYNVRVTNTGPSTAENVVVEDNLPAEVEIIDVTSSIGTCNAGTPGDPSDPTTCIFGELDYGQSDTMIIEVRFKPDAVTDPVTDEAIIWNDALTYADTLDMDISNNLAALPVTVQAQADLSLQKFAVGAPTPGTVMHYEFQIANLGPSVSRDVTLRDFLPAGMTFVSAFIDREGGTIADPLACDVTEGSNALFCPLGDIPPTDGTPIVVWVNVLIKSDVPDGTVLTNNADVLLTDTPDPDLGNNSDDVSITTFSEVNLLIEKHAYPQLPVAGTTFYYEITATNHGPSDAVNLVLTDTLPPGFTFMASDGPCTAVGQDITCTVGTLPAGESISFKIYVYIDPEIIGEFTNVIGATADNLIFNVISIENTIIVIGEADLHIEKFSSPTNEVLAGEEFTYVLLVDNYGPSTAYEVIIEDTLITSDEVDPFTCTLEVLTDGGPTESIDCEDALSTGVFTLAEFGVGFLNPKSPLDEGRIRITITAMAYEDLDMTNKATVVSGTFDPDTSDNFAVDTLSVLASADLYVNKSVDPLEFTAGETATYTIDFGNNGPSTADNVIVVDTLPAGVTLQSITWTFPPGSSGSCLGMETITCTVGTMAPADTGQIVIVVLVDPDLEAGSLLQNTVVIYDTETYDPDTSNNTDMVINAVGAAADLEITKTAEPVIALKGQTIEYTIVVTNNGPSDVYGAQIFDYFPAELDDVTWECDVYPVWGMCPASGTGDIEEYFDLKVGRSLTFTVTGVLTTNWPITNEACVFVPPGVVDPYPDNNCDDVTNEPFHALLPIVFGPAYRIMEPDLVITCLEVRPFSISLIIKNNGLAPVTDGFWLDIYLDPDFVPTAVNQPWYDVGDQGLVWGIYEPLAPGESLSMTLDSSFFGGRFSYVEWPIEPGTVAFAQVDSYNPYNTDGAVLEDHELLNGFYNNIFGPVLSVEASNPWTTGDFISALGDMEAIMKTEPHHLEDLPKR